MKTTRTTRAGLACMLAGAFAIGAGCDSKGPAEKAGENIDKGIQNAKDTISPPGPGEKAGRAVNKTLNP